MNTSVTSKFPVDLETTVEQRELLDHVLSKKFEQKEPKEGPYSIKHDVDNGFKANGEIEFINGPVKVFFHVKSFKTNNLAESAD